MVLASPHTPLCCGMETEEDMRLLGGPKLYRERSDISTWDWAESGWDEEVCVCVSCTGVLCVSPPEPCSTTYLCSLSSHCAHVTQRKCRVGSPRSKFLLVRTRCIDASLCSVGYITFLEAGNGDRHFILVPGRGRCTQCVSCCRLVLLFKLPHSVARYTLKLP